jgi:hypothetical protein
MPALRQVQDDEARPHTPPHGYADIAPTRFERLANDGYLTIDAPWVVPALLRSVPIQGRVLEPAAGRGHLSLELSRAGFEVASFDLHRYANPLVPDIEQGDIRRLTTLEGFAWVVTNLPYGDLEELATHLIGLGVRDHCGLAPCRVDRSQGAPQAGARTSALPRRRDADGKAALGGAGAEQRVAAPQFRLGGVGRDAARRLSLAQVRRARRAARGRALRPAQVAAFGRGTSGEDRYARKRAARCP